MNNTNNYTAELAYQKARNVLWAAMRDKFPTDKPNTPGPAGDAECWKWVNERKMSQSEIRLEVAFSAASTLYQFAMLDQDQSTSNTKFNTERRLKQQDSLIANEYGIYIANPASATDTAYQLRTYANQVDFSVAFAAQLNSIFYNNSFFQMTCNGDVVYPYRGLFNHVYKGETQQTGVLGIGSPADQIRGADDGMITLQPNMWLVGQKGYIPQIIVPSALTSAVDNAFARIILIFRGVLAQNSTSVS